MASKFLQSNRTGWLMAGPALALLLALLINQRIRGINVYRAIYFMPVVVSIVVVSLLWSFFYDLKSGILNNFLTAISFGAIPRIDWLGNPSTALGGHHRDVGLAVRPANHLAHPR